MAKEIPSEFMDKIIEMPQEILMIKSGGKLTEARKVAEMVKMIADTTQTLVYSEQEFGQRFGKYGEQSLRNNISKLKLKPRIIKDSGKVYVFANRI